MVLTEDFNRQVSSRDPAVHLWTYDMEPILEQMRQHGHYNGPTKLLFSQIDRGGVGRFLLDPSWHAKKQHYNVRLTMLWIDDLGPRFLWEALKDIKEGVACPDQLAEPRVSWTVALRTHVVNFNQSCLFLCLRQPTQQVHASKVIADHAGEAWHCSWGAEC